MRLHPSVAAFRRQVERILPVLVLALAANTGMADAQDAEPVPQAPAAQAPIQIPTDTGIRMLQDRPFDRAGYQVGPGDILAMSTTGAVSLSHDLIVTPEGRLLIPTVGVVNVLGLSLEEAEARVQEAVQRYYRNVNVHLTLRDLRSFKVFVVGAVPDPGAREASAATRVSELLDEEVALDPRASSATTGSQPTPTAISQRNVLLIRADGDTLQVDLVRFRQTGDVAYNPTLRSGDMILVPGLDQTVIVEGKVFFPGTYEYREDESLAEILNVANGYRGFPSASHDVIHVSRFVDKDSRQFYEFTRAEAVGERGEAFTLEPFDAIFVPAVSHFKEQRTAKVEGEVLHPGTYPIRSDSTTVRELISMAGGFTAEASLVQARLTRQPQTELEVIEGSSLVPVELLTGDEKRVLEVRRRGGEGNVVIDFEALLIEGEDAYNLTLRDKDLLTVPERRRDVTVLGAVWEPGIVAFQEDRPIDYYVDLAGGYTERADEGDVAVLKSKLKTMLERDEVRAIESGDTIVVPYKQKRDWLQIYQTTTSFVTSLASLVLFFMAATQ